MKIKKKIFAVLIIVGLLFTSFPVLGAAGTEAISLEKAQEMARLNSRTMQSLAVTKEKLNASLDITSDSYKQSDLKTTIKSLMDAIERANEKIAALPPGDPNIAYWENQIGIFENNISLVKKGLTTDDSALLPAKIAYDQSKNAYVDMLKTQEDTEKTLDITVEKLYFAIRDTENTESYLQKKLDLLGMQLRAQRLRVELGLSTNLDEQGIKVQYNQLLNSIYDLKGTKDQTTRQLNDLIGRPISAALSTLPVPASPVNWPLNVDQLLKKALDNSLELVQKQRDMQNNREYANDTSGSQKIVYLRQEELTGIEIAGLKEEIKQNTLALVESFNSAYEAWKTANLNREKTEISYKNAKIKYELGLISRIELDAEEVAYLEALYNEEKASKAWLLAKHKIELAQSGIFI